MEFILMDNVEAEVKANLVALTADVVSAYVANNSVQRSDVVMLIGSVHEALALLGQSKAAAAPEKPVPAVPIKKSVMPDYLVSLEDGRRYKSLRRHLNGRGLTPEQYRDKWGLPHDYPMVAPAYAKQRSDLAKSMGLGRQRRAPDPVEPPPVEKPRRKASRRSA